MPRWWYCDTTRGPARFGMQAWRNRIAIAGCLTLVVAACGGGTSNDSNGDSAESDNSQPPAAVDDGQGDTTLDTPVAEPVTEEPVGDTSTADGETAGDDLRGPTLEPTQTFVVPRSETTSLDRLAVSPTGDRIAVWSRNASAEPSIAVFESASGAEIVSTATDRDGHLYWSADDQLLMVENAQIVTFDSATLTEVGEPVAYSFIECDGSNGRVFDRTSGALFGEFNLNNLCRLDLASGESLTYVNDEGVSGMVVEPGGETLYAFSADDDRNITALTLSGTSMTVTAEAEASGPRPVLAAGAGAIVQAQTDGFEYEIMPAGTVVPRFQVIRSSYTGDHFVAAYAEGTIIIDSAAGASLGWVDAFPATDQYDWSSDDSVFATFLNDGSVGVFELGER